MRTRAILFVSVFLILTVWATCGMSGGEEISLPEIDGWVSAAPRVIQLETVSGNQGFWVRRSYFSDGRTPLVVNLMGGKGPKMLHIPPEGTNSSDGPIGSGASYEMIEIVGKRAVLEYDPVIGYSLAIILDDGVVTVESNRYGLEKADFIRYAEHFLNHMPF